jgi:hypothetical protein
LLSDAFAVAVVVDHVIALNGAVVADNDALQAFVVVVEAARRAALPRELQRAGESLAGQAKDGHFDLK